MTPDPFGTERLRTAALRAWRESPTRLREDANIEADYATGAYGQRVVVELAQNAADAAARAGVDSRMLLRLVPPQAEEGWTLVAANTGRPLDVADVRALAAMRSSTKVGSNLVGHFGVGFAAVRSVCDDVAIGSAGSDDVAARSGAAIRFSLTQTRRLLADLGAQAPHVAAELDRRGTDLPMLRLPFPDRLRVPAGYDTAVVLRLRDDAVPAVRRQLAAVDDLLLDAVGVDSATIDVDGESREAAAGRSWRLTRSSAQVAEELVAGLPVEERTRDVSLAWALPANPGPDGERAARRLHAPLPTEEPMSFPAVLLASFPLEPTRRHVLRGPLADEVARLAGRLFAQVAAAEPEPLALVPTGLPAGDVDAAVRAAAVAALGAVAILRGPGSDGASDGGVDLEGRFAAADTAGGGMLDGRVAPRDATVVAGPVGADPAAVAALGAGRRGLAVVPERHRAVARMLGAEEVALAELVDALPDPEPAGARELYEALAPFATDPATREALGRVPVPLAGGGVARGARGLLLLDEADRAVAAGWCPRLVDPRAAHPLLERLGARVATAAVVAADPAVRDRLLAWSVAVADGDEGPDAAQVEAALALAESAVASGGRLPFWWGELPLPTADGGLASARDCVVPGTWAAGALVDVEPLDGELARRWGADLLGAVGARAVPEVYVVPDVVTPVDEVDSDPVGPAGWLTDWSDYVCELGDAFGDGVFVGDVRAVADLDALDDPVAALVDLTADRDVRDALVEPVRSPSGGAAAPYGSWFLRGQLGPFALPGADVPFLDPAPPELVSLAAEVLEAVGAVGDLAQLPADEWPDFLASLPAVGAPVPARDAVALWRALAVLATDDGPALEPDRLPAFDGDGVAMVPIDRLAVAPDSMWCRHVPIVAASCAPEALAELVGAHWVPSAGASDPASPFVAEAPDESGETREIDDRIVASVTTCPGIWHLHEQLTVAHIAVPWWVNETPAGLQVHAISNEFLGWALAAINGRSEDRYLLGAMAADPDRIDAMIAETAWDLGRSRAARPSGTLG